MMAALCAAVIGAFPAQGDSPCASQSINAIGLTKSCGYHVSLDDLPLGFLYNNTGAPANLRASGGAIPIAALKTSINTWNDAWPLKTDPMCSALCYKGTTTRVAGVKDGFNVVQFGDPSVCGGSHGLAVACSWYAATSGSGRYHVSEVDIILDAGEEWAQFGGVDYVLGEIQGLVGQPRGEEYDLQSTFTHELGHALGLEDIGDGGYPGDLTQAGQGQQTMYGELVQGTTNKRTLDAGDIAGLAYQATLSAHDH